MVVKLNPASCQSGSTPPVPKDPESRHRPFECPTALKRPNNSGTCPNHQPAVARSYELESLLNGPRSWWSSKMQPSAPRIANAGVHMSEPQAKVKEVHHAPLRWQQLTQLLVVWSLRRMRWHCCIHIGFARCLLCYTRRNWLLILLLVESHWKKAKLWKLEF